MTKRRSPTHRAIASVEELALAIVAYAKAIGKPVEKVGRDGFVAAHRGRFPKSGEFDAIWSLAKSQASEGIVEAPPLEPVPVDHRVAGVSTYVDADGIVKGQWIKTREKKETDAELLARVTAETLATIAPRTWTVPAPQPTTYHCGCGRGTPPEVDDPWAYGDTFTCQRCGDGRGRVGLNEDLLAVYPLGDPHVGLLAWAPESGDHFDLATCEGLLSQAMRDLVLRGPRTKNGLVVNLGDFFHFDNANARTTKGEHSLDVDSRAPKVLAVGLRIMVTLVDAALEHHQHVTVDTRIGNHDAHTSLMLSLALAAHYRNEPRVTIPPTVSHRAYHEHGAVLIGTTHGDRAKPEDLAAIMAAEQPTAWGRTRHRYWLCGHVHHLRRLETRGCVVESFRTLAARDSWHAAQGYVSGRDLHRIVYHRKHGEVSREVVNVGALLDSTQ